MFLIQFLLKDIEHDAVSNWVLVFNVVNKSFKKSYAKLGKLYIDLQKMGKNA